MFYWDSNSINKSCLEFNYTKTKRNVMDFRFPWMKLARGSGTPKQNWIISRDFRFLQKNLTWGSVTPKQKRSSLIVQILQTNLTWGLGYKNTENPFLGLLMPSSKPQYTKQKRSSPRRPDPLTQLWFDYSKQKVGFLETFQTKLS